MSIWINGRYLSEPEIISYIESLQAERNSYKQELIDILAKAATCIKGEDYDCIECKYYNRVSNSGWVCPSQLSSYQAHLRLEELRYECKCKQT
jgi:hypothetical protein